MLGELRGSLIFGAQYLKDCHLAPGQFVAQVRPLPVVPCQSTSQSVAHASCWRVLLPSSSKLLKLPTIGLWHSLHTESGRYCWQPCTNHAAAGSTAKMSVRQYAPCRLLILWESKSIHKLNTTCRLIDVQTCSLDHCAINVATDFHACCADWVPR